MFKIFCDFDNTITNLDCTDLILSKFSDFKWLEIENDFKAGKITSKECLKRQIPLINTTEEELKNFVNNKIKIQKGFLKFVDFCKNFNYEIIIVSDGLDLVIKLFLKNYNISNIDFYSNKLIIDNGFEIEFPFNKTNCRGKIGTCKCSIINKFKKDNLSIYIGDGSSDYCAVTNQAQYIIAKSKLADFCDNNNISYYSFKDFNDVIEIIKELKLKVKNAKQ